MVIAGAGSGKTRVLTGRVAELISTRKVDPGHLLVLTFTNKAAKEMKDRVHRFLGAELDFRWMGTFHGVFARILRLEARQLGYTPSYTIYDNQDSLFLIRHVIKNLNLDDKKYKPNVVRARISLAKGNLVDSETYLDPENGYIENDTRHGMADLWKIFHAYETSCKQQNAMDFDDLLFYTHRLFCTLPDTLKKYQSLFRYILIDEFQDTNDLQYAISKKLSAGSNNIFVVGDDAQSIYSFRGANLDNILNFQEDFPGSRLFKLEQNYRSTKTILAAANHLIKFNKRQVAKKIWTSGETGDPICITPNLTEREESQNVVHQLFEKKMQSQSPDGDFAILYRNNHQSRSLEVALRKANIRYRIVGGQSFYQRKEIKDCLAYLRFSQNREDEVSLRRIINFPSRGIGEKTIQEVAKASERTGKSLWEVMLKPHLYLEGRVSPRLQDFVNLVEKFGKAEKELGLHEGCKKIIKSSGILDLYLADDAPENKARVANIYELLNAIRDYCEEGGTGLDQFLQETTLLTGEENQQGEEQPEDPVVMMTVHMSKGLEFPYVFLVGLEEGLFPSRYNITTPLELEEERRLFYVAITRAKKGVYLSYARSRFLFGKETRSEPSTFLKELPPEVLSYSSPPPGFRGDNRFQQMANTPTGYSQLKRVHYRASTSEKMQPSANGDLADGYRILQASEIRFGIRVEHPKFGTGKVVEMPRKIGRWDVIKVDFKNAGTRDLMLEFGKLRILDG